MGHKKRFGIGRFPVTAGVALCLVLAISQQGCSSSSGSPDPTAVRAAVAEARDDERQLVQSTIVDPERRSDFLGILDQRDATLRRHVADIEQYRAEFEALNADYYATRADLDQLVARYNQQREAAQQELVQLLRAMKSSTTQDEWRVISKFQNKKLQPRDLTYGGGLSEES